MSENYDHFINLKDLYFCSFLFFGQKLSEIFGCDPNDVFRGKILREIEDDFLNDQTNNFRRILHERKPGYVNLKIEGWFTKKQIIDNYDMLIKELDEWKVNEDGIRWKYR